MENLMDYVYDGLGIEPDDDPYEVRGFQPLPAGWVNLYSDGTYTSCPGIVEVFYFDNGFDGDRVTFEPGTMSEDPDVRGVVPAWAIKDGRYQRTAFRAYIV